MVYLLISLISQFLILNLANGVSLTNRLRPFSTDGCSMTIDGIPQNLWLNCCIKHDVEYWMGGAEKDRKLADSELGKCVGAKSFSILGDIFYFAVEIGGSPFYHSTWRWGYGWVNSREYFSRTSENLSAISQELIYLNSSFKDDSTPQDFPIQNLYCEDNEENFRLDISIYDNKPSTGYYIIKSNTNKKLITANIFSTLAHFNTPIEVLEISDELKNILSLNLLPSNDCISKKTNEKFHYQALILNHSINSMLFNIFNKRKVCCELLHNRF